VDRAVPIWGKPEDGNISDKTVKTVILAEIARWLAQHGVKPGAYIYVADAALVTEDHLAAFGDTLFISRLPATYNECGRVIAEAVSQDRWHEVGVLAHTKPTKHRPVASYKVAEGAVTLYGQSYRAVVVQSSTQDKRRLKRLEREVQASYMTLQETVRAAQQHDYFCRADAEAAAEQLRPMQSGSHQVEVIVEERPKYGKGRPSTRQPRPVKEMRYGLKAVLTEQEAFIARKRKGGDCFVLLTNVPAEGSLAHRAEEGLRAYKDQHGMEQNYGFLKAPLLVNRLFLKKPARIEALGWLLLLALLGGG
jgi:transposase